MTETSCECGVCQDCKDIVHLWEIAKRMANRDRLRDAKKLHADNPLAMAALADIESRIAAGEDFDVDCDHCGLWDGRAPRCYCTNRRCTWNWYDDHFRAEVY